MFYRMIDCDLTSGPLVSDTKLSIPTGIGANDSKKFGSDYGSE
jgi:hypothetical protein